MTLANMRVTPAGPGVVREGLGAREGIREFLLDDRTIGDRFTIAWRLCGDHRAEATVQVT